MKFYIQISVVIYIFSFSLLPTTNAGEIYKWVDAQGKIHFGDKQPENEQSEQMNIKVVNSVSQVSYGKSIKHYGSKLIMFTTDWCGYCKKAKAYFNANNIAFTEHNIEDSLSAKANFEQLGGKGVPLIVLGKRKMSGFSEGGFERFYNQPDNTK